jgi:hypothetical protein
LREVELTCGGTIVPRPSPNWLKYELISRARRADNVTRPNLDAVRFIKLSIRGVIMVSSVAMAVPFNSLLGQF